MRDHEIGAYAPINRPSPMQTYVSLERAYAFFNSEFFGGELPPCLITLQRLRRAYGYFSPARFVNVNTNNEVVDEIALNPVHFTRETPTRVLATLAHEMVHLWQYHFGKPGRGRYHNREWARMMNVIGLGPSDTGKPGGKPTGEKIGHYIREEGPFARACGAYLKVNAALLYQDRAYCAKEDDERTARERERKAASKTRYLCPACGLHAWAKPGVRILHMDCDEEMQWKASQASARSTSSTVSLSTSGDPK